MKTTGNTILITGGSAGIGFEIAKVFSENGNKVIITGRDEARLAKAASQLKNATPIVSDISDKNAIAALVNRVAADFPELNVVINNAGRAFYYKLDGDQDAASIAEEEMLTNYLSVIRLNQALLPTLKNAPDAAIVNVSSIAAIAANHQLATYAASKAALHSYSQSLRITLAGSSVKVFELMPPLVNTEFSQEIGGANGIPPKEVADELFNAFETETFEVRVGNTESLYQLYLSSPGEALRAMNPDVKF
ncbi:SDR family oxidoreductase [Dyadobacter crusticola]|uniref:SDR family oxidoreductase n=1 Tax=Dyadobacter crusticola TaxID=292407 RepID=UPI0004E20670|nr:SDR family NAD(P)-dependent oxidoreductase [Dyadobacter crusticola]